MGRKNKSESESESEESFDLGSSNSSQSSRSAPVDSNEVKKGGKKAKVEVAKKQPIKSAQIPAKSNANVGEGLSTSSASNIDMFTSGGPVTTEAAAKKLILQYLKVQNRPYSAIQVHDNLHGRIPKTVTERALVVNIYN